MTSYKPLLTAIKAEYEDSINAMVRGQKEAFFLSGKLKAMASEPSTLRNYKKRCDELEERCDNCLYSQLPIYSNIVPLFVG